MDQNEYFLKEIQERMVMLQTALSRGACTTFDEYKYTCGQIRGLEAACAIIEDLKQQLEHSDD